MTCDTGIRPGRFDARTGGARFSDPVAYPSGAPAGVRSGRVLGQKP
jgi:hypothetical protein